jgi:hypothetical protein
VPGDRIVAAIEHSDDLLTGHGMPGQTLIVTADVSQCARPPDTISMDRTSLVMIV